MVASFVIALACLAGVVDPTAPFERQGPAVRPPAPYAYARPTAFPRGFARGVCYPSPTTKDTEFGTPGCKDALAKIKATGADFVSLCPYFVMGRWSPFLPAKFPGTASRDAVRQTIVWAHEVGLKVILRPQVVTHVNPPRFHLKVEHREDWMEIFGVLDVLIRDAAELAQDTHCEALSLGTRLAETLERTPQNWDTLIARVREVYHGKLTYDADWRREVFQVPFWDKLDFISMTLYQRLGEGDEADETPGDIELQREAQWPTGRLCELYYKHKLPVWISEVGFPSNVAGARHPFQRPILKRPVDPVLQQRALATSLLVHQDKRWLAGVMVWGFTGPGGAADTGYSPAGKPAWDVLKRWFAPGPARDGAYYERKSLVYWIDDWF